MKDGWNFNMFDLFFIACYVFLSHGPSFYSFDGLYYFAQLISIFEDFDLNIYNNLKNFPLPIQKEVVSSHEGTQVSFRRTFPGLRNRTLPGRERERERWSGIRRKAAGVSLWNQYNKRAGSNTTKFSEGPGGSGNPPPGDERNPSPSATALDVQSMEPAQSPASPKA